MKPVLRALSLVVMPLLLLAGIAVAEGYDSVGEIQMYPVPPGPPPEHRRHRPPPMAPQGGILVDCSGMHRDMFHSVNEAAFRAPPGARLLILPPDQGGGTCRESVEIRKPLTIASYGGGADAVIEAPRGRSCLSADIPLGDTLTIDGVRFIARSPEAPCLDIMAGKVAVRRSTIDSRSTKLAFDVRESADLTVSDSHIETDGSGIHANRARVALSNVDIDIEVGNGVGLDLEQVDGSVDGGSINGGSAAIRASAGARELRITGTVIRKSDVGVKIDAGGLGTVFLNRLSLNRDLYGIVVAIGAEADITGNVITEATVAGIEIPHDMPRPNHVRIDGNTITVVPPAPCIRGRKPHGNDCRPPPRRCLFCWWD